MGSNPYSPDYGGLGATRPHSKVPGSSLIGHPLIIEVPPAKRWHCSTSGPITRQTRNSHQPLVPRTNSNCHPRTRPFGYTDDINEDWSLLDSIPHSRPYQTISCPRRLLVNSSPRYQAPHENSRVPFNPAVPPKTDPVNPRGLVLLSASHRRTDDTGPSLLQPPHHRRSRVVLRATRRPQHASSQGRRKLEGCTGTAASNKGSMGVFDQDPVSSVSRNRGQYIIILARHQLVGI
jgi:hypothetical protein